MQEPLKLLELFSGSRSVSKVAEKFGMETFSVDWENYEGTDLVTDIGSMGIEEVPFIPDVLWASPDCKTYSMGAISKHRRNTTEPVSEYAKECDITNRHWLALIDSWLAINPDMVYFIENPRGALRHMDFMQDYPRKTVWYCQYGDDRAKPTDIWTNSPNWTPRPVCRNYKYDSEGNIIDKHCHHQSARRGAKTGTQGRKGSYERSQIPKKLCWEVVESVMLI